MGIDVAAIANNAINTAGNIVTGLIYDCILRSAVSSSYDAATGNVSNNTQNNGFRGFFGKFSMQELQDSEVRADDRKLCAAVAQFIVNVAIDNEIEVAGDRMYTVVGVDYDSVKAMYSLHVRPKKS